LKDIGRQVGTPFLALAQLSAQDGTGLVCPESAIWVSGKWG